MTEQEFNGLHWRTVLKQDTDQVLDGLDQVRRQYYDAAWRLVFESVDDGWTSGFGEDRIVEQFWGLRYIDDAVLRRAKPAGNGGYVRQHYLTDVQFSVVAVLSQAAGVAERVWYTPYGEARHFWGTDANGDFQVDSSDASDITSQAALSEPYIGGGDYLVEMDLDRDGDIDSADAAGEAQAAAGDAHRRRGRRGPRHRPPRPADHPWDQARPRGGGAPDCSEDHAARRLPHDTSALHGAGAHRYRGRARRRALRWS